MAFTLEQMRAEVRASEAERRPMSPAVRRQLTDEITRRGIEGDDSLHPALRTDGPGEFAPPPKSLSSPFPSGAVPGYDPLGDVMESAAVRFAERRNRSSRRKP